MEHNEKAIKTILSRNLKKYRATLGLTQEQASEKADLSLNYWQRLEMISQRVMPSIPTLFKIAKVLNCKPKNLLE
jgi:transcriptional regulator with XRE-family HTH domain